MSEVKRVFVGKGVEMLTVCDIIVTHAIDHKGQLQALRSTWADPYFENLQAKIQETNTEFFGLDGAKHLREATALINALQVAALKDLGFLKVQIEEDFKKDKAFVASVLKTLGFADFYRNAQMRSQEALVQLLFQFKQNLTDQLKNTLVGGGTNAVLLEGLVDKAENLRKANVNQEVFKGDRKSSTQEATIRFNDIYEEVISICKIATKIFKDNAVLKDQFSYAKNLQTLTGSASAATLAKKAKAAKALETA